MMRRPNEHCDDNGIVIRCRHGRHQWSLLNYALLLLLTVHSFTAEATLVNGGDGSHTGSAPTMVLLRPPTRANVGGYSSMHPQHQHHHQHQHQYVHPHSHSAHSVYHKQFQSGQPSPVFEHQSQGNLFGFSTFNTNKQLANNIGFDSTKVVSFYATPVVGSAAPSVAVQGQQHRQRQQQQQQQQLFNGAANNWRTSHQSVAAAPHYYGAHVADWAPSVGAVSVVRARTQADVTPVTTTTTSFKPIQPSAGPIDSSDVVGSTRSPVAPSHDSSTASASVVPASASSTAGTPVVVDDAVVADVGTLTNLIEELDDVITRSAPSPSPIHTPSPSSTLATSNDNERSPCAQSQPIVRQQQQPSGIVSSGSAAESAPVFAVESTAGTAASAAASEATHTEPQKRHVDHSMDTATNLVSDTTSSVSALASPSVDAASLPRASDGPATTATIGGSGSDSDSGGSFAIPTATAASTSAATATATAAPTASATATAVPVASGMPIQQPSVTGSSAINADATAEEFGTALRELRELRADIDRIVAGLDRDNHRLYGALFRALRAYVVSIERRVERQQHLMMMANTNRVGGASIGVAIPSGVKAKLAAIKDKISELVTRLKLKLSLKPLHLITGAGNSVIGVIDNLKPHASLN